MKKQERVLEIGKTISQFADELRCCKSDTLDIIALGLEISASKIRILSRMPDGCSLRVAPATGELRVIDYQGNDVTEEWIKS